MWQNSTPAGRLTIWRELRSEISPLPLDEQLSTVAKCFSTTPIGSRTVDYYSPDSWPTPWDILFHGTFCINSISIIMYHTFRLDPSFKNKIELFLVNDGEDICLLPVIDSQYVLNYELGAISKMYDLKNRFKIIEIFQEHDMYQIV